MHSNIERVLKALEELTFSLSRLQEELEDKEFEIAVLQGRVEFLEKRAKIEA